MNDGPNRPAPARELQLRAARSLIARELGAERITALQAPNRALDMLSIFGSIALFLLLAGQLATGSARDPLWWLCLVLQGDLIVVMSIVNHDLFVHRKVLPPRLRWVLSQLLAWPAQIKGAIFESRHLTHHRELGTERDTEFYKRGLDSALRRWLYITPALLVFRSLIYRETGVLENVKPAHGGETRVRWEKNTRRAIWVLAVASLAWDWRLFVFGYLVPLAFVAPAFNTVRIMLEHFDMDRANPLWVGTFYRTGFLSRPLFLWSTGDCHLVHHYYANIPYYRMPQALRLMRPILLREGVYEHRSLLPLLADWFTGARSHWSLPAAAAQPSGEAEPRTA